MTTISPESHMPRTIAQVTESVKLSSNFSSYNPETQDNVESHECNHSLLRLWHFLTPLQKQIIYFYYSLRLQGIEESNYSLNELAIRFRRHADYVARQLAELQRAGWLYGLHGGSRSKKRGITCGAFTVLDSLQSGQMSEQIEYIPYIDLSDPRSDHLKIIKEAQVCGQVEEKTPDHVLDEFLNQQNVPLDHQLKIKKSLRMAPIGPIRRENIIKRVVAAGKKMFIKSKLGYFMSAIGREIENMENLIHSLSKKNAICNPYDTSNLTELGCFA